MKVPASSPPSGPAKVRELRIHGRGGQGAVIASKLLASALFREGLSVQSFPAFGVERRGAPVAAFLRYSDGPILLRCEVTEPDDLIVLDPTLVQAVDVTAGLEPGGTILINSERPPESYPEMAARYRVVTVDASGIARRRGLGSRNQPIVNTAILGAFAASTGLVGLESVCVAIAEEIPVQPEANVAAARDAAAALAGSATAGGAVPCGHCAPTVESAHG
jgi:pyruvate ferredoxin oxidoreductase gamma subunit/2-oxoisovalerate ferredoxin oxidoreductase gamma subunit